MKKVFVLALLALVVALAIPKSRARILTPVTERIRAEIAPRRLDAIANQLQGRLNRGEPLPTKSQWENWLRSSSVNSAEDPWGNVYYLERRRDGFVVGSNGPDGRKGTADDFSAQR